MLSVGDGQGVSVKAAISGQVLRRATFTWLRIIQVTFPLIDGIVITSLVGLDSDWEKKGDPHFARFMLTFFLFYIYISNGNSVS